MYQFFIFLTSCESLEFFCDFLNFYFYIAKVRLPSEGLCTFLDFEENSFLY